MTTVKKILIDSLPWILVGVGLAFIIIGFIFEDSIKVYKFLTTTGSAILSSGVFAVILKTFQFVGVFKDELSKVITGNEYINRLSTESKTKLWKELAKSIHKDSFPKLSDDLHEKILNNYFPTDKQYYYRKYVMKCEAKLIDKENKIVETTESTYLTIVPKSKDELIEIPFVFRTTIDENDEKTTVDLIKLERDEEDISGQCRSEPVIEKNNGKVCIIYKYDVQLHGKEEYSLIREVKKKFCINADPYSRFDPTTFIQDSSVHVKILDPGLSVVFVESGTIKHFDDRYKDKKVDLGCLDKEIDKTSDEILFPGQGYVLHYQFN